MTEPEKIVFRLSKSVWKERSTLNKIKTEDITDDDNIPEGQKGKEPTSPVLRPRSVHNKVATYNPSGCPKCGTLTTCNNCLRRKEQELRALKSKYKAMKSSQIYPEKNWESGVQGKVTGPNSPVYAEKMNEGSESKSPSDKVTKLGDKPKRGRKRSVSENPPSTAEALQVLHSLKASISCDTLQNYFDIAEHEMFQCGFNSMSYENVLKHLASLRTEFIQRVLRPVLQSLIMHPRNGDIFNYPVDPVALGLKDYFVKIEKPMDLGTVKRRLLQGHYQSIQECVDDVTLVFRNATEYNPVHHIVHQAAVFLFNVFQDDIKTVEEKLLKEEDRRNSHHCQLCQGCPCSFCGEKCHKLEPPIIVCHGPCGQRIKRLGIYYVSINGTTLYCQKCYTTSGPVITGDFPLTPTGSPRPSADALTVSSPQSTPSTTSLGCRNRSPRECTLTPKPLLKKDMLKRRFDEEIFEPWIDCSTCHRRIHQACAMFNPFYESPNKNSDVVAFDVSSHLLSDSSCANMKVEQNKMTTRHRGRHKKGSHLHLTNSESRYVTASSPNGSVDSTTHISSPFQCVMCKLKRVANSSKRGKGGPPSANTRKIKRFKKPKQEDEIGISSTLPVTFEEDRTPGGDKGNCETSVNSGEEDPLPQAYVNASNTDKNKGLSNCHNTSAEVNEDVMDLEGEVCRKFEDSDDVKIDGNSCDNSSVIPTNGLVAHSSEGNNLLTLSAARSSSVEKTWRASSLPKTKLGDFIESMVKHRLREVWSSRSFQNSDERETAEDCADSVMNTLTIRVVANSSRSMDVPDIICDNLPTDEGNRVPPYFVYRQKCILLFQEIDGVDVCLFCLYVQEFDSSCPEPNKSRVYIAYLDSVEYFRPRQLRTHVYYEIIIAYLKWAQARGFKCGHIWACPPQRGDNFIFWCHPSQQRTPSRDRLTSWYNAMLSRAKALGICSSVQNLWTCFFEGYGRRDEGLQRQASKNSYVGKQHKSIKSLKQAKKSVNVSEMMCDISDDGGDEVPICPPVFEGDFWVTECTRVFRLVQSRTQGVRYDKDKALNQRKCREILKTLMTKPIAHCFNQPVDPIALKIPDYPKIIKKPMDFGTIRENLRTNIYRSMFDFAEDVRLTCRNAMTYNPAGHAVHIFAKELLEEFEKIVIEMVTDRVGEIFATSNDVNTWLGTYPVNNAMEKEERKKRAKEQQQQRTLIANQKMATGGTECYTGSVIESSDTTMADVDAEMSLSEGDASFLLNTGRMDVQSISADGSSNTLCGNRRVLFSSSRNASDSDRKFEFENDGYGFVDCESIKSDDSRIQADSAINRDATVAGLARRDSVESMSSVLERWPRRPDRTTSMCVDDSMESLSQNAKLDQNPNNGNLSINLAATYAVSNMCGIDKDRRSNSLNTNLPFEKPQLGVKGAQALMSELSKNVCRLKDDMYVVILASKSHQSEHNHETESINEECMRMLESVESDTSDPDLSMRSPFIESRQTFLEMCQFRHLQFDSLRRAKFSSNILIFHLLFPRITSTRPQCKECKLQIKKVRWHCDSCAFDYDICNSCKFSATRTRHLHEDSLTPIRVSYM